MSRRSFFGEAVRATVRSLGEVAVQLEERRGPKEQAELAHDFTPELLAMEAERLGLDPIRDRDEILKAVRAALARPVPETVKP
ncbi:MAG: hypothetical protein V3573_01590 [Desulfovibrionaceae bacterium]